MRFDEILPRSEGPALAEEIAALRTPGRYLAEGVHQEDTRRHGQFRFLLDEPNRSWVRDRSDEPATSRRDHYAHGTLHGLDGPVGIPFERSMDSVVHMATPELMPWWGRGHESFSPLLVQRVGRRSILITFEHEADPAVRTTLVVDERDGIARRRMDGGAATILTSVRPAAADEGLPAPRFTALTDWIRPDY